MKTFLTSFLIAALAAAGAAMWALAEDPAVLRERARRLVREVPSLESAEGRWAAVAVRFGRPELAPVLALAGLRLSAWAIYWPHVLGILLLFGLRACRRREELEDGSRVPSPSTAFLAKRAACSLLILLSAAIPSPLPVPAWSILPFTVAFSFFLKVYVQNLPASL